MPRDPNRAARNAAAPRTFGTRLHAVGRDAYLDDPAIRRLVEFFEAKTLAVLKDEDRREQWYADWIAYQGQHHIYASVLSPQRYSTLGSRFDPLRFARFIEVFASLSPAHGYSAQVTFLGLFAILMGTNDDLKREAVAALERGGLLAFAISERDHGADLLGNEFTLTPGGQGDLVANGSKFYIGNSNAADLIAVMARRTGADGGHSARRAPMALFALRPAQAPGFRNAEKIRTLGVRAGHVGHFEVKDHPVKAGDLIAEGRGAWDAVLGTVTLGKFFLGFGSIGICERALHEAASHVCSRRLYGKAVFEMPHIRAAMSRAYARLTAMKLYAFRALDYVHAAHAGDRRYGLFCAVQKAKVSTEGVKTMAQLSECIGARGFDASTYFEMALRDVQLIPGLEGSTHINLDMTARYGPQYLSGAGGAACADPPALVAGEAVARENAWLAEARAGRLERVTFPDCMVAYRPLQAIRNVRIFARRVDRLRAFALATRAGGASGPDPARGDLAFAQCLATVVYGQLIAENAVRLRLEPELVSAIFHLLLDDLSAVALTMASGSHLVAADRRSLRRLAAVPQTAASDWAFVARQVAAAGELDGLRPDRP